jgi:8-oxo-dGTP pyrophosphatase MutT (NUDIX family)
MQTKDIVDSSHSDPHAEASLGAGAVLLCAQKVLLVQINYGRFAGSWILPGGMVQPREHPYETAVRETKEETGLDIRVTSQIAVRHRIYEDGKANVYFVFRGVLKDRSVDSNLEIPELAWPAGEIMEARFWDLAAVDAEPGIRPQTKTFIRMSLNAESIAHPAISLSPDAVFNDSIFGARP